MIHGGGISLTLLGGGVSGSLLNISEAFSPATDFQMLAPLPQLSSLPPVVCL